MPAEDWIQGLENAERVRLRELVRTAQHAQRALRAADAVVASADRASIRGAKRERRKAHRALVEAQRALALARAKRGPAGGGIPAERSSR